MQKVSKVWTVTLSSCSYCIFRQPVVLFLTPFSQISLVWWVCWNKPTCGLFLDGHGWEAKIKQPLVFLSHLSECSQFEAPCRYAGSSSCVSGFLFLLWFGLDVISKWRPNILASTIFWKRLQEGTVWLAWQRVYKSLIILIFLPCGLLVYFSGMWHIIVLPGCA